MSSVKKGQLTAYPDYNKHLRPFGRQEFWGRERAAARRHVEREVIEITDARDEAEFQRERYGSPLEGYICRDLGSDTWFPGEMPFKVNVSPTAALEYFRDILEQNVENATVDAQIIAGRMGWNLERTRYALEGEIQNLSLDTFIRLCIACQSYGSHQFSSFKEYSFGDWLDD